MIGYTQTNNEFYTGQYVEHKIKSAVSKSGGNYLHYELFNNLLTGSLYNNNINTFHQDCRAGYSLLFIYPLRIRIILSLIFYRAELDSLQEYEEYDIKPNLIKPVDNLLLINKINKISLSKTVVAILQSLPEDFILHSKYLKELTSELNISKDFDLRNLSIEDQLRQTFLLLNNNYSINNDFIDIISSNNRTKAAIYICRQLNYKLTSINIISQAVEQWTIKNLSI